MKAASLDLLKGTGWKPGDKFSFHSVSELMVALALKVQKGEIGCDYPSLGSGGSPPPEPNLRVVTELPMTAFTDAAPQRDEMNGEQTILTYNANVGVWDLAFFESGEEFPDKWFGDTHWIDISGMWPGVIAQVATFAESEGSKP